MSSHGSPGRLVLPFLFSPSARNPIAHIEDVIESKDEEAIAVHVQAYSPWRVTADETITSHMLTFGDG